MRLRGINGKKRKKIASHMRIRGAKIWLRQVSPRKERHKLSTDGIFQTFLEKKCLNFRQ